MKMLDVTAPGSGDVAAAFLDYSRAANRALVEASYMKTHEVEPVVSRARALGEAAILGWLARIRLGTRRETERERAPAGYHVLG